MVDISMKSGTDRNFRISVFLNDLQTPAPLTGGVLRFLIKRREEALIFKSTYKADEIDWIDDALGTSILYLTEADMKILTKGSYCYETIVTRRGDSLVVSGTMAATAGSSVLACSGVDFDAISIGDILVPAGALSGNQVPFVITDLDEDAQTITTDYTFFETEAGISYGGYAGDNKKPDALSGTFTKT